MSVNLNKQSQQQNQGKDCVPPTESIIRGGSGK